MADLPDPLPSFVAREDVPSLVGSIRTRSLVARPKTPDDCREVLAWAREHGLTVCPRGGGRSYGDMALHDDQVLLDVSGMNRILDFDEAARTVRVEPGTRLIDIFAAVHHKGLTLAASPTESHSSVSGAVCANVNGKDGWRLGSFGDQVVRLTLLTADGATHEIGREHPWFDGIVGGLGLVGIVLDVTLKLEPVPSPYVESTVRTAKDVDELLAVMAEEEERADLLVAWVNAYAKGDAIGRSVIHASRWTEVKQTEEERKAVIDEGIERLDKHRRFGLAVHGLFGPLLSLMLQAQRPFLRFFNWLYYAKSRLGGKPHVELFMKFSFEASFTVPPAYLVCGPHGYTIQITFPRSHAREALVELLEICQSSPCPPVTTILRAHRADDHWISFSEDGYSLNFEIHPKKRHVAASREVVDRLVAAVARYGGKLHLAKDQVLTPEQFRSLYPRYEQLLALKRELDPEGLFASDLARRVGLVGDPV